MDGAAVMMGRKTGVGTQLQSKHSPFCVQTHCIAHRLNLACTDTIKKEDFLVKFRDKFSYCIICIVLFYKCFTFSCFSLEKYLSPVRRTRIKDKGTLLDPLAWFKKSSGSRV